MAGKYQDRVGTIVSEIRKKILHWQFVPGSRMPEEELSKSFGTSRIPLREAFRILEANGFLEKEPNKGYRVKKFSLQDSLELYDLRIALETHICEQLATKGISPDVLANLRNLWSENECPPNADAQKLSENDRKFHEELARVHGNRALLKQLAEINDRIAFLRIVDFEHEVTVHSARKEHLEIIQAIEDKNPPKAREAMRQNILHAQANIRKGFTEMLARTFLSEPGQTTD